MVTNPLDPGGSGYTPQGGWQSYAPGFTPFGVQNYQAPDVTQYPDQEDFIWRAGQGVASISPNDNLIGFQGNNMPGGNTTNQSIDISINGADDPQAVVTAIQAALDNHELDFSVVNNENLTQ